MSMCEWRQFTLDELYEFASGLSKPRSEFGSGFPFLSFKDVFYNYFIPRNIEGLVRSDDKERNRCSVRRGDVFLTRTSETMDELGMSCVALRDIPDATFNGFTKRLRPKTESVVIPEYAGYFFRSRNFRQEVQSMTTMATRASLNNEMLKRLTMRVPPVDVQFAISRVLLALDDKIELNRKTAATLEAMARALYRSWFVDFDPVHAKAAGHPPAHMDKATAALFPDSFRDDGLPEGWVMEPIGRHVSLKRGLSYKGKYLATKDTGLPLHNLNSIKTQGGYSDHGLKFYSGDFSDRHLVQPGDLIVANTDLTMNEVVIGFPAVVPVRYGPNGLFSQHLFKIEPDPNSPLSREWLYLGLASTWIGRKIRAFANGTTVNMLPRDALEIPDIPIPSASVVEMFNDWVEPMFKQQETLNIENQTLASLRDTLLPRLMSGELRVGETREIMKETL